MNFYKKQVATLSTLITLSLSTSAFAIDVQDFSNKLSATLELMSSTKISFNNVEQKGNDIIITGIDIPTIKGEPVDILEDLEIIFENVKENKNGSYSAKNAQFRNIDYSDDGINIKVNDIVFSDILISADPMDNIVETMMIYKEFSAGPLIISKDEIKYFEIESFFFKNKPNSDKSVFMSNFEVNGIYSDLSKIEEEEARVGLAAIGLNEIDGQIKGSSSWSLNDGRSVIDELSIDFKNIGRLNITIDLVGYTLAVAEKMYKTQQEMIEIDPTSPEYEAKSMEMLMSIAAQLSFNEFSIRFDDDGISNKAIDLIAAQQGANREQFIAGLVMMAPAFLAEFNMPELQAQVSKALSTYLNDPNNIEIKAAPTNPTPIMAFVALANNPPALLELLNLDINANQ